MWRALLITAGCFLGCLGGCTTAPAKPVPLAKAVQAALQDPSTLPRAATPVAAGVGVAQAGTSRDDAGDAAAGGHDASGGGVSDAAAATTDAGGPDAASADAGTAERDAQGDGRADATAPPAPQKVAAAPPVAIKKSAARRAPAAKPTRRATRRTKAAASARPRSGGAPSRRRAAAAPAAAPDAPLPPGKDATDLYYDGKRAMAARNYTAAIAALRASQQLRASPRTLTLLGRAYFDAGRLKDAERAFSRAGNRADALVLLATLYQQMGRSAKARRALKALLTYHPNHARADWARRMLKTL